MPWCVAMKHYLFGFVDFKVVFFIFMLQFRRISFSIQTFKSHYLITQGLAKKYINIVIIMLLLYIGFFVLIFTLSLFQICK